MGVSERSGGEDCSAAGHKGIDFDVMDDTGSAMGQRGVDAWLDLFLGGTVALLLAGGEYYIWLCLKQMVTEENDCDTISTIYNFAPKALTPSVPYR